ncbi:MAG: amidohydrolase family protein [Saprospiraceae bacterium]|nr:amidohydrolase family protein [Saprospiraceae bacterium]
MFKKMALFVFLFGVPALVFSQNNEGSSAKMDFEAYDPPSDLVTPAHEYTKAKFPFIDIHSHHWQMANQDLDKLLSEMNAMNMQVVNNLSGRGGAALKSMMDNVKKYGYEKRVTIFTNIELRSIDDPEWAANTVKQIEFDHANGACGLKIYKSQGMDNKDAAGNRIKITDPRIKPIWDKCAELNMPILIHSADPKQFWEPFDSLNERWLELKTHPNRKRDPGPFTWEQIISEQHDLFRQNPKTKFIAAHMAWFPNDLAKLGKLLDEMPNVYVEIGAVISELGRQPRMANKFFEKYQDRVLFGKDSYQPGEYPTYFRVLESDDEYFPYYKRYHAFWKMYGLALPDHILKKVYYKNALSLLPNIDASQFPK